MKRSKNIIHSAKVVDYFRRSQEFGIRHDGFTVEMSGVRDEGKLYNLASTVLQQKLSPI
jgi:hypothetical protein